MRSPVQFLASNNLFVFTPTLLFYCMYVIMFMIFIIITLIYYFYIQFVVILLYLCFELLLSSDQYMDPTGNKCSHFRGFISVLFLMYFDLCIFYDS